MYALERHAPSRIWADQRDAIARADNDCSICCADQVGSIGTERRRSCVGRHTVDATAGINRYNSLFAGCDVTNRRELTHRCAC